MRHALWLAWRYLASGPTRAIVLVLGVAVAGFLPLFTVQVGRLAEATLLARADATPVLVGHAGNEFDLVMASLYWRGRLGEPLSQADVEAIAARDPGVVVPLHLGVRAGGAPVVGTTWDYLDVRGLQVAEGRRFAVLGEAVVGASLAAEAHLAPGDTLRTDQDNLYDLAGAYPLRLSVVGVLGPTGTPDDDALFVDVKTTWVVDGLLHGHEAVDDAVAIGGDDENIEASLAMFLFAEIDPATLGTFHLHGAPEDWPVHAIAVWPHDRRRHDQLLGDLAVDPTRQAIRPGQVVRALLDLVLRLQELLGGWAVLVGLSTVGFVGLVIDLSVRLRRDELVLLRRLGAGRATVVAVLGAEIALVLTAAAVLALGGTWAATAGLSAWLGV